MSTNTSSSRNSSLWIGLIVVAVGFFLLMDRLDVIFFPYWFFSWPVLLIVIGLVIGIKKNFKSVGWLILVLIGAFFLLDEIPGFEYLRRYSLPIGVIIVGFFLVFRASVFRGIDSDRDKRRVSPDGSSTARATEIFSSNEQHGAGSSDDYIDLTTVFGGIKKKIFSKSFKGGQTTNFFGGTELDLTQADIDGDVVLDVVQAFGGVKLIVPSNWELKSELTSILGGIDDKRSVPTSAVTNNKRLIITGTCIFGSIDIRSYN
jgi:hypothetical protein